MAYTVYLKGPVAVALDASPKSFKSYKSGVYHDPTCKNSVNHGMLLVGFDQEDVRRDNNYWIIKNSWSTSWGTAGYMHMRMWENTCNVARYPDYPIV